MRNLNEPLKRAPEEIEQDQGIIQPIDQADARVVSIEDRQRKDAANRQSLISKQETEDLRERWTAVQTSFVDEPRKAVKDADELVSKAISQLSENFRMQRSQLEKQWSSGTQVSTEDLRICLQQYRLFFDRLLSI